MKILGLPILFLYIPFVSNFVCADTEVDVVPTQIHNLNEDLDLVSFLNSKTQKHDGIFSEALKLLESINSSSSCNKLAATKLVTSCKSIGRNLGTPTDSDIYLALEYVRSLYAARLAICEISGAGISIPSPCQPMNVSPAPRKARFSFYTKHNTKVSDDDPGRKEELGPCLRSLESRPQWWTSYSNSKQNAMVICHASRSEIEKEDILATYNTILQSSTKLSDGLLEALRVAIEESARGRAFMRSTELLRNEALREMEESTSSLVIRMSHKIETRFASFTESISSVLNAIHVGFSEIQTDLENSSSEAISLRNILQYMHNESLLRNEQIALTQRRNADTQDELALSLRSKLQAIARDDMSRLSKSMGTLDSSLEWLYMRMGDIIEKEESFSERLSSIGLSLEEFQLRVDSLGKIQERQYEIAAAQAQAQEELQTDIRISKGILDQTASTAANLQTTLDASMKWRESSIFGGLLGHHTAWIIPGALWTIVSQSDRNIRSAAMLVLICVSNGIL